MSGARYTEQEYHAVLKKWGRGVTRAEATAGGRSGGVAKATDRAGRPVHRQSYKLPRAPSRCSVIIYGEPVGKPRMTQQDKWKLRDRVTAYRTWADLARLAAFKNPRKKVTLDKPTVFVLRAYFDSGTSHRCGPHTLKPDIDNIEKACLDALFTNDQMVYKVVKEKRWCDGGKPRVEVEWFA